MAEPQHTDEMHSQPRTVDNLLELYIKIGGYFGVGLAIAAFAATCCFSYWLFYISHLGHFNSGVLDILIILGTLVCATLAAVTIFFCASVFWLPILIGLYIFWSVLEHLLLKLHQVHLH